MSLRRVSGVQNGRVARGRSVSAVVWSVRAVLLIVAGWLIGSMYLSLRDQWNGEADVAALKSAGGVESGLLAPRIPLGHVSTSALVDELRWAGWCVDRRGPRLLRLRKDDLLRN